MSKIRQAKKKPQKQENTQPTLDQIAEGHTLQKDLFERVNIVTDDGLVDATKEYIDTFNQYKAPYSPIQPLLTDKVDEAYGVSCFLSEICNDKNSGFVTEYGKHNAGTLSNWCTWDTRDYFLELITQQITNLTFQAVRQLFIDMGKVMQANPEIREYLPSADDMFASFVRNYRLADKIYDPRPEYICGYKSVDEIDDQTLVHMLYDQQAASLYVNSIVNGVRNIIYQMIGTHLYPSVYDNEFLLSLITYFDASGVFHLFRDNLMDIFTHINHMKKSAQLIDYDYTKYKHEMGVCDSDDDDDDCW